MDAPNVVTLTSMKNTELLERAKANADDRVQLMAIRAVLGPRTSESATAARQWIDRRLLDLPSAPPEQIIHNPWYRRTWLGIGIAAVLIWIFHGVLHAMGVDIWHYLWPKLQQAVSISK